MEKTDLIIIFNKEDNLEYLQHSLYFAACWGSKNILVLGGDATVAEYLAGQGGKAKFSHEPGDFTSLSFFKAVKNVLQRDGLVLSPALVVICQDYRLWRVKQILKNIIPQTSVTTFLSYPVTFVKEKVKDYQPLFRFFNFDFYALKLGEDRLL